MKYLILAVVLVVMFIELPMLFALIGIGGILFVFGITELILSKNLTASVMKCPNCGSDEVRIQSTGGIFPKREGICQKCGFNYSYLIQDEIDKRKKIADVLMCIGIVILSVCFVLVYMLMTTGKI